MLFWMPLGGGWRSGLGFDAPFVLGTLSMASKFRHWFEDFLRPLPGRRIEWPQLLRQMFYEEVGRVKHEEGPYQGQNVFIDRGDLAWGPYVDRPDQHLEELSAYRVYRQVHEENDGALAVEGDQVWLVTLQVPNQERFRGRRADLVGIRTDGSIVVFECKVGGNRSDSPLVGLFEGLDYLSHLLIDDNFDRFSEGLDEWRAKHGISDVRSLTPDAFHDVAPVQSAKHAVVVLAPQEYYELHRLDSHGVEQGWHLLSDRIWPKSPRTIDIDFWVHPFSEEPCFVAAPLGLEGG